MNKTSIYQREVTPMMQAATVFGLILVIFFGLYLSYLFKWYMYDPMDIWMIGTAMMLFFILFNCIFGFNNENITIYFRNSIYSYIVLVLVTCLLCQWITKVSVFDAKTYSWILVVFSIVYIIFMTVLGLIKKIVSIDIKQDKKLKNED